MDSDHFPHPGGHLPTLAARRVWPQRLFFHRGYRGLLWGGAVARSRGRGRSGGSLEQPVLESYTKTESAVKIPKRNHHHHIAVLNKKDWYWSMAMTSFLLSNILQNTTIIRTPQYTGTNISFKRNAVPRPLCFAYDELVGKHPSYTCVVPRVCAPCTFTSHLAPCNLRLLGRVWMPEMRQRSIQPGRQRLHGRVLGYCRQRRGKGDRGRFTPFFISTVGF